MLPPEPNQADVRELLRREGVDLSGSHDLSGQESDWQWPTSESVDAPTIAYLLPGLPQEGSGGSHSLVQEARGMWALGASTRICVPAQALAAAQRLYGNDDGLFVAYPEEETIAQAVGDADVVVSTEHTSVRLAERLARERPEVVYAYYVQDYEPLFAPSESARSDRALLSYRAISGQVLYAKTHWLRNVVMALHGVEAMKVEPSLDRSLFHPRGRSDDRAVARVVAMVRPRTPRRRARATLLALQGIARALGEDVQVLAFGCERDEFDALCTAVAEGGEVAHLGLLTRAEVAGVMRRSDVFIDASAYQAFGRTGLEAMACGAVPLLPALGGVREYAEQDGNAVIFEDDSPEAIVAEVCALLSDRERLARLRAEGVRTAARFSIERAARSQLGLFAALTTRHARPGTVARA